MTLCAWCGEPLIMPKKYQGELICLKCYEGREESMEDWQRDLDDYLTNQPEGPESKCVCCECKEVLNVDDEYYLLEGDIYCESCAENWLKDQRNYVNEYMAYGG